jgi:hypothetical protein
MSFQLLLCSTSRLHVSVKLHFLTLYTKTNDHTTEVMLFLQLYMDLTVNKHYLYDMLYFYIIPL